MEAMRLGTLRPPTLAGILKFLAMDDHPTAGAPHDGARTYAPWEWCRTRGALGRLPPMVSSEGVVLGTDEIVHVGPAAVAPVHQVMPVNPQMYVETGVARVVPRQGSSLARPTPE